MTPSIRVAEETRGRLPPRRVAHGRRLGAGGAEGRLQLGCLLGDRRAGERPVRSERACYHRLHPDCALSKSMGRAGRPAWGGSPSDKMIKKRSPITVLARSVGLQSRSRGRSPKVGGTRAMSVTTPPAADQRRRRRFRKPRTGWGRTSALVAALQCSPHTSLAAFRASRSVRRAG